MNAPQLKNLADMPFELRHVEYIESSERWKAMIQVDDEATEFIYVFPEDALLIVRCGYDAQAFESTAYGGFWFPEGRNTRPLIKLHHYGGKWRIQSVWCAQVGEFMTHQQDIAGMIEQTKQTQAPIKPGVMTTEYLAKLLKGAIEKRRKEREEQRITEKVEPPSGDDLYREEAEILLDIVGHIDRQGENLGKVMLLALWTLRQSRFLKFLPNAPESVTEALRRMKGAFRNPDYVLSLAMVVDRIFPDVEAMQRSGKPYLHPKTGQPISVESLIVADGLIRKLTKSSDHWTKLFSDDDKRLLMSAIVSQSADKVAALRETQQGITKAENRIPMVEKPVPGKQGFTQVILTVNETQYRAVMRILKPLIQEVKMR